MPTSATLDRKNPTSLTLQQKKFCQELMSDPQMNPKRAAIAAGYKETSASTTAAKLLSTPKVRNYLRTLDAKREKEYVIKATEVLQELGLIAFFDPANLVYRDGPNKGQFIPLEDLPSIVSRGIAGLKVETEKKVRKSDDESEEEEEFEITKMEYKFHPKVESLNLIARHLGMLVEKAAEQKSGNHLHIHAPTQFFEKLFDRETIYIEQDALDY